MMKTLDRPETFFKFSEKDAMLLVTGFHRFHKSLIIVKHRVASKNILFSASLSKI